MGKFEYQEPASAIVACTHYHGGKRIPCPPMCPCQSSPDPRTNRGRRRQRRAWKADGTYRR